MFELDNLIARHKALLERTPYNDQETRQRLQHALDDFAFWKEKERNERNS